MREQKGQIIRISERWFVRYWERRSTGGTIERKRVTHLLGNVTTRGKRPPADIVTEAQRHMATVNSGTIPAERIVTIEDFVEAVYLPWTKQHKRPSTAKGYRDIWEDHLKPRCNAVWLKDTRTFHIQAWLNQIGAGTLSRNTLNYHDGEMFVSRSIWNGRVSDPKTRKGRAPVPVIRPLADRLEMHRLRSGNPKVGPIFVNSAKNPLSLSSLVNRTILPALNRCGQCSKGEQEHKDAKHPFERDARIPEWHGWHAARRGLGSNLYRLGVPDMVIQRILRHANVSTTATYYIKTAADDVKQAMEKLENNIPQAPQIVRDTYGTLEPFETNSKLAIQ